MLGWFKKRRAAKEEKRKQENKEHLNEQEQNDASYHEEQTLEGTPETSREEHAVPHSDQPTQPTIKDTTNLNQTPEEAEIKHGSLKITDQEIDTASYAKLTSTPSPVPTPSSEEEETRKPELSLAEEDEQQNKELSGIEQETTNDKEYVSPNNSAPLRSQETEPETPEKSMASEETADLADDEQQDHDSIQEQNEEHKSHSLFKRLASRLSKTRESIVFQMDSLFMGKKVIDAELLDDLEELLITSDIGINTAMELLDYARTKVKRKELDDPEALKKFIKKKLHTYVVDASRPAELVMPKSGPFVIMVVGVNGVGKTTTIGKIAHKFVQSGQSVLLAAGDTFRAAAVSQLKIWGERNGVEVVSKEEGADPSAVAFDAMARAVEGNFDVVLFDTAGRLHTQSNLMEELKKIKRVMGKKLPGAPHEVLLVLDATTGQNGISQAKLFDAAVDITGLALTKLDGTAKGGIVVNISRDMNIPIRFIGIGETIDDLRDFDADEFIAALFGDESYTH